MTKRRNFSDNFKAAVALEALRGDKTVQEIAANQVLLLVTGEYNVPDSGCRDITYSPVKNGFLYLVAITDWATRKVLTWRLSNTLPSR